MKRINITNIFIMLLASFLLGVFWAKPQYRKLKEKNQIIFQKEIVLKNTQQRRQKIQSVEEELKKYSGQMEIIKTAIPDSPSLFSFLNYIQKAVSENGLLLKNYSYSVASSKAKPKQKQKKAPSLGIWSPLIKPSAGKAEKKAPSQSAEGEGGAKAASFNLSLFGPYSAFLSFLSDLEKNSRLIEIDKVSLFSGGAEEPTDFNVNLKIYSY